MFILNLPKTKINLKYGGVIQSALDSAALS